MAANTVHSGGFLTQNSKPPNPKPNPYLERPPRGQHGHQVVERHGRQHGPRGPLRQLGEPEGDHRPDKHKVALLQEDGHLPEEDGEHAHDREVPQDDREGDDVERDAGRLDDLHPEDAAQEAQDREAGEAHVAPDHLQRV
jgi:hypothetical protein